MDTTVSLRASGKEAKEAVDEGFDRLDQLDKLAGQNEDSDVSRINAAAGREYVQVDPAVYEMIEYAKDYSAKSQGEWDITVGVMTNLWRIGNDDQHVPSADEISRALMKVNYKDILLRPEDHSVMLAKAGMAIDLGGVAKGYAVDEIRKIYEKHCIIKEKGKNKMTKVHEMRYNILKAMDTTIRSHSGDEGYIESWLMVGIPDGSTDLDFQDYAEDEEGYLEFVETFHQLLDRMDKDPYELTKNELIEKFLEYLEMNRYGKDRKIQKAELEKIALL